MKTYRYPGVRPFEATDSALFFGRDRDIADLYEMVRAERLVVLFGKSGYGKSSLLNAGVLPRLREVMTPLEVRLGEYIAGQSLPPVETLRRKAPLSQALSPESAFLADLPPTLWTHFKQLDSAGKGSYLLVFDQFEEFFSYPPGQQRDFRDQLADLLNGEPPEDLRERARSLDRDQRRLLTAPMDVRVLFAIRSDRMHELDRLKDRLPAILHKRYELKALSREQAREAIVQPALLVSSEAVTPSHRLTTDAETPSPSSEAVTPSHRLITDAETPSPSSEAVTPSHRLTTDAETPNPSSQAVTPSHRLTTAATPEFHSPPFEYREDALQKILAGLAISNTSQQSGVEAFQLQILCDSIENKVAEGLILDRDGNGLPDVTADDLPDFTEVFAQYYERRLALLPEAQHSVARRVIEDGLVRYDPATDEGRRLSVDGQALLKDFEAAGLSAGLLRELENTFLVRREPNTLGGHNYELSHDTLLAPVVRAKKRRMAEEAERRRLEEEAAEKERLRLENEQQRRERDRARRIAAVGFLLAGLAVAAAIFAFLQTTEAKKQKAEAFFQKTQADSLLGVSEKNRLLADEKTTEAEKQKAEADKQTVAALIATQNTAKALNELEITSDQAVTILLAEIDRNIYRLEYDSTFRKCQTAINLKAQRGAVEKRILEIAYFYTEADTTAAAVAFLNLLQSTGLTTKTPGLQAKLRAILKERAPSTYLVFLEERYFPQTIRVEGGSFLREDDSVRVSVRSFQMAKTEITFWQYSVFAKAKHHSIGPPSWQFAGDNPAVNVNWFDAAFYLNWLSERHNRKPVYIQTAIRNDNFDVEIDDNANGYRLPTEAEWEFAARGGNLSKGFGYSGDSVLVNVGWYWENSNSRTHPVKQKKPNELDLYDMSGNVWEWCRDWYGSYDPAKNDNPVGPEQGGTRVIRGGSWGNGAQGCRAAYRYYYAPEFRDYYLGFRLVGPL